ncbi:glycosyltransferase family 4 protein [Luteimonas sp. MC1825]|uniref:glycosyltransferase family 4 protein n=1 Tax=Luteimonas sp. MC1825 TaxID=2761107 RepID=UPI001C88BCBB|nr:glycosyltransferase family 4 protein [Luteimonas sp. MC1825]
MRTFQYLPQIRAAGFDVDVVPLFDDDYIRALYSGAISRAQVFGYYLKRIRTLSRARAYDIVWFEKELMPWLPTVLEQVLLPRRAKLILDCDDAVFHRYDAHASAWVRGSLGPKIGDLMARVDLVIAGNAYLAQHARASGAVRVEVVPTVVDLERYPLNGASRPGAPVVIGWIGSPSTAGYLKAVAPALRELQRGRDLEFVAIGANPDQVEGTPFRAAKWSEESEARQLQQIDIGIMPLPDAPWERGKCGYKLVQYMASGLPVVASPVGINTSLVIDGVNGYLASGMEEWTARLTTLVDDPALRVRMGAAGRAMVEERYCLQVQGPRLVEMMQNLLMDQVA